jgi:hypothetical protein
MVAWGDLTGVRLRLWEIDVIMALDEEYRAAGNEDDKDES